MKTAIIWILCAAILIGCAVIAFQHLGSKPDESTGSYDMGVRYFEEGRFEDAILMFSETIDKDPNCANAYFYRAETYLAMAQSCPDPEMKAVYLELAAKDYIRAEVLDSSLAASAESRLAEVEALLEEITRQNTTIPPQTVEETQPATEETPDETTVETTVPEETVSPTYSSSHSGNSGTSTNPTPEEDSSSDTPAHNPKPAPVVPDETVSTPLETPEVDYGEPPAVQIPDGSTSAAPEHSSKPAPVIPDEVSTGEE